MINFEALACTKSMVLKLKALFNMILIKGVTLSLEVYEKFLEIFAS